MHAQESISSQSLISQGLKPHLKSHHACGNKKPPGPLSLYKYTARHDMLFTYQLSYNHLISTFPSAFEYRSLLLHTKDETMAQQAGVLLLPFFIIMLSSISCCSSTSQPNLVLRHFGHHEESGRHDSQAYSSYFSNIADGEFKDLIKAVTDAALSLKRFNKVGTISSTSVKTVNVDDFGAEGDGTHYDTEVLSDLGS